MPSARVSVCRNQTSLFKLVRTTEVRDGAVLPAGSCSVGNSQHQWVCDSCSLQHLLARQRDDIISLRLKPLGRHFASCMPFFSSPGLVIRSCEGKANRKLVYLVP